MGCFTISPPKHHETHKSRNIMKARSLTKHHQITADSWNIKQIWKKKSRSEKKQINPYSWNIFEAETNPPSIELKVNLETDPKKPQQYRALFQEHFSFSSSVASSKELLFDDGINLKLMILVECKRRWNKKLRRRRREDKVGSRLVFVHQQTKILMKIEETKTI